jgi:hypothetical protein
MVRHFCPAVCFPPPALGGTANTAVTKAAAASNTPNFDILGIVILQSQGQAVLRHWPLRGR